MAENDFPGRPSDSYGQSPYDHTPEGFDTPGDRGAAGTGAFPAYPGSETSGGAGEYQPFTYTEPGEELVQSNGTVSPVGALGFGFSRFFKNILPWLGIIIVTGAFSGGFNFILQRTGGIAIGMSVSMIVSLIISCVMLTGALKNVNAPKVSFGEFFKDVNWLPIIVVSLASSFVNWFVTLGVFFLLPGARNFVAAVQNLDPALLEAVQDTADTNAATEAMVTILESLPWGGIIFSGVIAFLLGLLLRPLLSYWVFYAADHRAGIGGAISQGFNDGLKNYSAVILFEILATLVTFVVSVFSFFILAGFVVAPIMIARALVYRQMSKGQIPASVVQ